MKPPHKELLSKAVSIRPAPVAVEAAWDGDTQGWFVELLAVVPDGDSFALHCLGIFDGGGDMRLLNGQVPPWPEAEAAAEAGTAVARGLGVPFFFPSPQHPEDACPHWWQKSRASPCQRCGILLLQEDTCRWRGVCHQCYLDVEREKREAAWTPEERAAPRCQICGSRAVGQHGLPPRCATCRERYEDGVCKSCGVHMIAPRDDRRGDTCGTCAMRDGLARLTRADRVAIQDAYAVDRLEAVVVLSKLLGCGVVDADRALDELSLGTSGD